MDADGFHENNNFPKEEERETSASPETPTPVPTPNQQEYSAPVAPTPVNNAPQTQTPIADTPTASTPITPASQNNAGIIILQWLAYAFWGWLILGLLWVVAIILYNSILNESADAITPYALSATIVLLPIAYVTDFFYIKHEPVKKTGAAAAVMSIHAVMYALFGIGALIVAVFTALTMAINTSSLTSGYTITLLTALAAAVFYAGVFVRIINPAKTNKLPRIYGYAMFAIAVVLATLSMTGPFAKSITTKDDKLIEQHLASVQYSIEDYADTNKKMPASLNDVTFKDKDAEDLVTSGKVTYKQQPAESIKSSNTISYPYQLCATYKASKGSKEDQDRYITTNYVVVTTAHGAGNICYNLNYRIYLYNY